MGEEMVNIFHRFIEIEVWLLTYPRKHVIEMELDDELGWKEKRDELGKIASMLRS